MRFGLHPADIAKLQQVFSQFPEVDAVILYGSRAKGNFRPGSDIDLAVVGPLLTDSLIGALSITIDDLLLPYQVDLSRLDAIENDSLRAHIERVGQPFYQRRHDCTATTPT